MRAMAFSGPASLRDGTRAAARQLLPCPVRLMRRLRHHVQALRPRSEAAAEGPAAAAVAADEGDIHPRLISLRGLYESQYSRPPPPPIPVGADGQLQPATIAALEAEIETAASSGDFQRASELSGAVSTLRPDTIPMSLAAAAVPQTPAEKADFFVEHGFTVVENCFAGEDLSRLQASWRRAQAPARQMHRAALANPEDPIREANGGRLAHVSDSPQAYNLRTRLYRSRSADKPALCRERCGLTSRPRIFSWRRSKMGVTRFS